MSLWVVMKRPLTQVLTHVDHADPTTGKAKGYNVEHVRCFLQKIAVIMLIIRIAMRILLRLLIKVARMISMIITKITTIYFNPKP